MVVHSPQQERFLVTGAYGCIGTWVLREVLGRGDVAVAADVAPGSPRLRLVLDGPDDRLVRAQVDVTDMASLERAIDEHSVTRIIHLAALQVPFCRADPPAGAAINIVGTANVLEAARRRRDRIPHVVYASSVAVYDSDESAMTGLPGTLYGVYKRATEQMASRYLLDEGLPSIGLRPHTVFGPARDQGLTSAPTTAMLAAAAGRAYEIPYGGHAQFQYAPDVARAFVQAALAATDTAAVYNLAGTACSIADVVDAIVDASPDAAGLISFADTQLDFPATVDSIGLVEAIGPVEETPLRAAVAETIERFRTALADGRLTAAILGPSAPVDQGAAANP
jgi:nucleoside-diphosphate-sugar epimerase